VPPLGFAHRVLPNGLQVYTSPGCLDLECDGPGLVPRRVQGRSGRGRSGFAHLFEHLMFKSTRNLPNETFDRLTEDVGGFNNASTWDDFTNYYEVVPANHLERLIFAEAERMGSLVVDEQVFASERDVVKEECASATWPSPTGAVRPVRCPRRSMTIATPTAGPASARSRSWTRRRSTTCAAFHATYYRPDNAVLIVAGNFDDAQLDAWVDKYFGGHRPIRPRPLPANNVQSRPNRRRVRARRPSMVPMCRCRRRCVAWRTVAVWRCRTGRP
jgi:zinc protease